MLMASELPANALGPRSARTPESHWELLCQPQGALDWIFKVITHLHPVKLFCMTCSPQEALQEMLCRLKPLLIQAGTR